MKRRKGPKNVDIAGRSTSKRRDISGEFLEGTESSVNEIEPTGAASFAEVWNAERTDDTDNTDDTGNTDAALDGALGVGEEDRAVRNLDQSRAGTIAGWTLFVVGLAALIIVVVQQLSLIHI